MKTQAQLEKMAEEWIDKNICYGGLEYPLSGNTAKECTKSYLAGAQAMIKASKAAYDELQKKYDSLSAKYKSLNQAPHDGG